MGDRRAWHRAGLILAELLRAGYEEIRRAVPEMSLRPLTGLSCAPVPSARSLRLRAIPSDTCTFVAHLVGESFPEMVAGLRSLGIAAVEVELDGGQLSIFRVDGTVENAPPPPSQLPGRLPS